MNDDEEIEHLKTTPPRVEYTRREKIQRTVGRLLLGISLALGSFAVIATYRVAACTNANLGQRSAPSRSDAKAHIDYALAQQRLQTANAAVSHALADALAAAAAKDPVGQQRAGVEFAVAFQAQVPVAADYSQALNVYVATLTSNQEKRDKHPLGHC